jgi:peroxiredoxin Q/BCP
VVGVSGDSPTTQGLFKKIKMLNFTLLADEKGKVASTFGVPFGKGGTFKTTDADGNPVTLKRGVTISRWTFVIGKDGKILYKNPQVNINEDRKAVLKAIEKASKE